MLSDALLNTFTFLFIGLSIGVHIIIYLLVNLLRPFIGSSRVRSIKSFLAGVYLRLLRAFCCDVKVVLTGDIDKVRQTVNKKSILLQNHQTEVDWIILQYFYQIFGKESDFSAIMKGSLGSVPLFGYCVRDLNMCLLERNWEKDRYNFDTFISNYVTSSRPVCALLCPEGTTISKGTCEKSQRYAKRTNRPVFEHVLLPRSTGLAYMVNKLSEYQKQTGQDFYIYDLTIQFEGYSGELCDEDYKRVIDVDFPSLSNIIWDRKPMICHMHVKVTPLSELANGLTNLEVVTQNVEKWLDKQWIEKEEQMNFFIKNQRFDDNWSKQKMIVNFDTEKKIKDSPKWFVFSIICTCLDIGVVMLTKSLLANGFSYLF